MNPQSCWIGISAIIAGLPPTDCGGVVLRPLNGELQYREFPLVGESRLLALSTLTGAPIGILLDRLTDYPNEVLDCPTETVINCVQYLRSKYPNGQ